MEHGLLIREVRAGADLVSSVWFDSALKPEALFL
jgi:hypothetical protein